MKGKNTDRDSISHSARNRTTSEPLRLADLDATKLSQRLILFAEF